MKTVYLLIGLPGAGKSTFAKTKLKNSSIIELDEIRQELSDKGIVGKKYSSLDNSLVFKEFNNRILNKINSTDSIVIDATNARISERKEIYELLKAFKPKYVAINFLDSKKTVVERIKKRQAENPNCVHIFDNPEESVEIYAKRIEENKTSFTEPLAEIWYVKNCEILKKEKKILIASTNLGKIQIYKQICDELNLFTTSLNEIKVDEDVNETGKNEVENANLKAKAYHKITGLPVIANDSGLIIDKFKPEDQPGVLVRRFGGKELSDKELLDVFIQKLTEVGGKSTGHYIVALSIIDNNGKLATKEFNPQKYFINIPSKVLIKGIPLSSLCYDKKLCKYESEMTMKQRNDGEKEEMQKQKKFIQSIFCK